MNWPNWMADNVWQWLIWIAIGVIGIIVSAVLALRSKRPSRVSSIETENTEKIIRLLEEKGYDANPQLVSELQGKIEKLEKELEERTRTTEDERAEEALIASNAGNYEKARELYGRLRKVKEAELARIAYNLGNVYFVELDFPKALEAYLDAVRLSHDDPIYLNEVGYAYYTLAQYDKAIGYYENALQSDLKTFGDDHPNVATSWNNLGLAWKAKGEYDKAIEYYEKALRSDLNTEHPNVATHWNNLGEAWKVKGEYDKAIEYYEKALQSDLNTFGEDHPQVAIYRNNLGAA